MKHPKTMTADQMMQQVENLLQESTDCYLLLAFSTSGDLHVLKNAPTVKDVYALNQIVDQVMKGGGVGMICGVAEGQEEEGEGTE